MATPQEVLEQKRKEALERAAASEKDKAQANTQMAENLTAALNVGSTDGANADSVEQKRQQEEAAYKQKQEEDERREKEQAEKLEKSRLEQEEQDKKDELAARLAAAQELLSEHGMTPATTPNAGGNVMPVMPPTLTELQDGTTLRLSATREIPLDSPMRTFQHQYANASVITEKGKRLVFGGPNGGIGYYTTNKLAEIEILSEIADTPGSMVTEVKQAADGRYLVADDPILQAEKLAVQRDSRANTAADLNPQVQNARQNLSRNIAQNS
jgi:hypothetical protein